MFKLIFKTIEHVFDVIFGAIKSLHLQIFFLLAVVALFVNIGGKIIVSGNVWFWIFHVLFGLSLIYAVIATVFSIRDYFSSRSGKVQSPNISVPNISPPSEQKPQAFAETAEKPNYYRVSQDERYVMAEYKDRYELYLETEKGKLQYVRTDYKK